MGLLLRILWMLLCLAVAIYYVTADNALTALLWGVSGGVMLGDMISDFGRFAERKVTARNAR